MTVGRIFIFLILLIIAACSNRTDQKTIVIQPIGDFDRELSFKVLKQIKTINQNTILAENIPFPKNSYYKPRNRYRADSIIKNLKSKVGKDTIIIGLASSDISTTKNGIHDWGIMGLGYRPGKSCVVSSFRLSKKNRNEQFYKVALHELGHTEGLPHCEVKTCLMRDAEGKNPLDEEKIFCLNCRKYLIKAGWKLK